MLHGTVQQKHLSKGILCVSRMREFLDGNF